MRRRGSNESSRSVVVARGGRADLVRDVLVAAASRFDGEQLPGMAAVLISRPPTLAALRELARHIDRELVASFGERCRVGVGGAIGDRRTVADSRDQAEDALDIAERCAMPRDPVLYEDVLVHAALLHNPRALRVLARVVAPLADPTAARLRETLEAYYEQGLSPTAAARALGVHRHTVEYRLEETARVLGRDLDAGRDRLVIEVGLVAQRMIAAREPPGPR